MPRGGAFSEDTEASELVKLPIPDRNVVSARTFSEGRRPIAEAASGGAPGGCNVTCVRRAALCVASHAVPLHAAHASLEEAEATMEEEAVEEQLGEGCDIPSPGAAGPAKKSKRQKRKEKRQLEGKGKGKGFEELQLQVSQKLRDRILLVKSWHAWRWQIFVKTLASKTSTQDVEASSTIDKEKPPVWQQEGQ